MISIYQKHISPLLDRLLGHRCRFYPSCSHYAKSCFEQFSFMTAFYKTLSRLFRCQPWHRGGVDLP